MYHKTMLLLLLLLLPLLLLLLLFLPLFPYIQRRQRIEPNRIERRHLLSHQPYTQPTSKERLYGASNTSASQQHVNVSSAVATFDDLPGPET